MIRTAIPGGAVAHRTSDRGASVDAELRDSRPVNRSFLLSLFSSLLLLACGNSDLVMVGINGEPEAASLANAQLQLVAGDVQEGEVASFLPAPLVVEVTDTMGAPLPNAPVEWVFANGGGVQAVGQGPPADTIRGNTDADGRASIRWQLGTRAGMQSASVQIVLPAATQAPTSGPSAAPGDNNGRRVGFQARGKPSSADAITISPDDPALEEGDAIQLDADVSDRYGNLLDSVSVNWSSNNEVVAQVTQSGMLQGVSAGTASVVAQYGRAEGSVTVAVAATSSNQAPTAAITSPSENVTVTLGDAVDFQGSASDADGTVASHRWVFGDGNTASLEDPGAYTYGGAGTYGVTYQVTDDQGATSPVAARTVTVVAPGNQVPTAAIASPGQDVTVTLGESVDFQGSASDADGTVASHSWVFGDGNTASVEDPGAYTYGGAGTYSVTYQVTDDQGATSPGAARTITVVAPGNQAPTAAIASPGQDVTVTLGESVDFQGSASDADGTVASHSWVFGDGNTASLEDPGAYTYGGAGTYSVTYQVTDDQGATSPGAARTITVVSVPPPGSVFFQEGFEDSNLTSRGWYDLVGWAPTTAEAHSGSGSLEVRFTQGAQLPVDGAGRHLFTETESVYLSYWVKYSANWVGSGDPFNPHEFYLLTNQDSEYTGPASTHLTVYVEQVYQSGGNVPAIRAQDARNIDLNNINQDLTGVTEQRSVNGCNGSADGYTGSCWPAGGGNYSNDRSWVAGQPYFLDAQGPGYKNDWHFVEAYVRLNTIQGGVGVPDGVIQYWFDGQPVLDYRDVLLRTGARPSMRFNQLLIGPWIASGSPVGQSFWIDDLTVGSARPPTP